MMLAFGRMKPGFALIEVSLRDELDERLAPQHIKQAAPVVADAHIGHNGTVRMSVTAKGLNRAMLCGKMKAEVGVFMIRLFKLIRSLFPPKLDEWAPARELPPRSDIVEMMYDQPPWVSPNSEIVKVIYSSDRERRFVITRDQRQGFFQFQLEYIYVWDEDEWLYFSRKPDALPAMWEISGKPGVSFFGTEQEAWNELVSTPEYQQFFHQ